MMRGNIHPRVFLDFALDTSPLGRVIIELYSDSAPKTAENFRALCTGEKGVGSKGFPLYYKNSTLHRCIKDFMLQGGDFTMSNGTGGESIYGGNFADEDLSRPLDSHGLLCMANRGPNTNGSQFFITLRECPHLNGKHVVFGKIIRGYDDVISKIANVPTDAKDRPTIPVIISNCGELELRKKEPERRGRSESVGDRRRRSSSRSVSRSSDDSAPLRKKSRRSRSQSSTRSHSSMSSAPRRKKKKAKKSKKEKPIESEVVTPRRPNGETEAEYDARLEREENQRLEAQRLKELERLKRLHEEAIANKDGVRFKGRGRMKYIDPETRR